MRNKQKHVPAYLDGYVSVYEDVPVYSDFGARLNEMSLTPVFEDAPFSEMSQRQSDIEFAQQSGFSLSKKIKIQYCRHLFAKNKKYKAKIGSSLYDVSYFDSSESDVYLYMEYIREVSEK